MPVNAYLGALYKSYDLNTKAENALRMFIQQHDGTTEVQPLNAVQVHPNQPKLGNQLPEDTMDINV
ncbi:unnamed protein product [Ilex paraguariensis]|uniref:Uncharacterized protein n=1 Tax=Ilex paraguariensis TaxID=185542 RepID=A0ABC8V5C3_9AQUA